MGKLFQKATVRPLLSLIGMLGFTVGFFLKMVDPVAYGVLVSTVVVWWFKSRDEEKAKG